MFTRRRDQARPWEERDKFTSRQFQGHRNGDQASLGGDTSVIFSLPSRTTMPRIKPPHIELPAPVFELERCTVLPEYSINPHDFVDNDSDDEEIEYALDLGAESPPRSAIEEKASWDIMPSGAEFSPVSSSSEKVCGCGKWYVTILLLVIISH